MGVDLEYIRQQPGYAEIARQFFSAREVDELTAVPRHLYAEAFLSCWTKKEAYLKACGEGLTTAMDSFCVPLTMNAADAPAVLRSASNGIARANRWVLYTLRPAPGYIGALAIQPY